MKLFASVCSVCTVVGVLAATPAVKPGSVRMTQDPSSFTVVVEYEIENGPCIVTPEFLTNGHSVGTALIHVVGDVNRKVGTGRHTFAWKPEKDVPGLFFDNYEVTPVVKVWPLGAPPDYMVLYLSSTPHIQYFEALDALPDGGVTNEIYKTSRLAMRRVHAAGASFIMGSSPNDREGCGWPFASTEHLHQVSFTKDFYLAVYETTVDQYNALSGSMTFNMYPKDVKYDDLRGTVNWWPNNGHDVDAGSWLYDFRAKFGDEWKFDLPTEAQWEFACRAGTDMVRYADRQAIDLAQTGNSGTARAGSHLPNDWGFYDMLGNAWEVCLDQYGSNAQFSAASAVDPVGYAAERTDMCLSRGGGYWDVASTARCAMRNSRAKSAQNTDNYYGMRLACDIEP